MLVAGGVVGRFLLKLIAWTSAAVFTGLSFFVFIVPIISIDFWPFKTEPTQMAEEIAKPNSPTEKLPVLAAVLPPNLEEIVVPPYERAAAALALVGGGRDQQDKQQVASTPSSELFIMAVTSQLDFNSAWATIAWNTQLKINVAAFLGTTPAKPDLFASRTYQSTNTDSPIALGFDQLDTKSGWCVLKSYLPCFMPLGYGRETVVREKDPDLKAE